MTEQTIDLSKLREPFPADAIEWRIGQSGKTRDGKPWAKVLAYLTSRAVMDRLDDVVGPENWRDEYAVAPHDPERKSLVCTLSLRINGEWIGKTDGANPSDMEPIKGCLSDAFKRAAVKFGIGRYLYDLGDSFAECTAEKQRGDGWTYAKTKAGVFYWRAPPLPASFLPSAAKPEAPQARPQQRPAQRPQPARNQAGADAEPADPHRRGDDHDWRQWLEPPAEVESSEEPHPWYCQAIKGLMRHCGVTNVGQARALLTWAMETPVEDPNVVKADAGLSQTAWQKLIDAHRGGEVPFTRMLHEAQTAETATA